MTKLIFNTQISQHVPFFYKGILTSIKRKIGAHLTFVLVFLQTSKIHLMFVLGPNCTLETDGTLNSSARADMNSRKAVLEIGFGEKHGCLLKSSLALSSLVQG